MPAYKFTRIVVYLDGKPLDPQEVPDFIAEEIKRMVSGETTERQIVDDKGVYTWKTFIEEGLVLYA